MSQKLIATYGHAVLFDKDPREAVKAYLAEHGTHPTPNALDSLIALIADQAVNNVTIENERKMPR